MKWKYNCFANFITTSRKRQAEVGSACFQGKWLVKTNASLSKSTDQKP